MPILMVPDTLVIIREPGSAVDVTALAPGPARSAQTCLTRRCICVSQGEQDGSAYQSLCRGLGVGPSGVPVQALKALPAVRDGCSQAVTR